jgi:hypothetical protein
LPPGRSGGLGANVPPRWQTGHQVDQRVAQPSRVRGDRIWTKQSRASRMIGQTLLLERGLFRRFPDDSGSCRIERRWRSVAPASFAASIYNENKLSF